MKISEIKKLIKNEMTIDSFFYSNKKEIMKFINDVKKEVSSVNIYIEEDDIIEEEDIVKLLLLYLDGEIFEWDLEYIFRVIEMSENKSECIDDIAFLLSDPYLGVEVNRQNIESIIESLKGKKKITNLSKAKILKLREAYKTFIDM